MTFQIFKKLLQIAVFGYALHLPIAFSLTEEDKNPVQIRLLSEFDAIAIPKHSIYSASLTFWLGLEFQLTPEWHLYWKNPGSVGRPPQMKWDNPSWVTVKEPLWPPPEIIQTQYATSFGYFKSLFLLIPVKVKPNELKGLTFISLKMKVQWFACQRFCQTGQSFLTLTLPIQSQQARPTPFFHLFSKARAALPKEVPPNWKVSMAEDLKQFVLSIESSFKDRKKYQKYNDPFLNQKSIFFFPEHPDLVDYLAPQTLALSPHKITLDIQKDSSKSRNLDLKNESGILKVGNDFFSISSPLVPMAAAVAAPTAPAIISSSPSNALNPGVRPLKDQADQDQVLLRFGQGTKNLKLLKVFEILWISFLGGLILNLMPCVFPILSMKAFSLLSLNQDSLSPHSFDLHAQRVKEKKIQCAAYTLGILVSFWVLAFIILVLRKSGHSLGWGFQLQSPTFIVMLSFILFGAALLFFDFLEIQFSPPAFSRPLYGFKGWIGTFFTGVFATVVATPCTAPFMGTALAFGLTQPSILTFFIFSALGTGLATPYCILCFYPFFIRFLPKPGIWMIHFKHFLGFPLLATVLWLIWVFGQQTNLTSATFLQIGLLLALMGAWLLKVQAQSKTILLKIFSGLFFGLSLWVVSQYALPSQNKTPFTQAQIRQWQTFSKKLAQNLIDHHQPFLINFTAAWCLTCQVNAHLAFTPEVLKRLGERGITLLKADWTHTDPEITQALQDYGSQGVPLYLFYSGQKGQNLRILPQVLTAKILLDLLKEI